jgi:quercetin dioxygenase-like cupin family protein
MRHPNIRNADELEIREMIKSRNNMRLRQLGKPAGSRALGATLTEVAPGAISFPRHAHCANEEAIYVLSGSGEARIGEARVAVRPGDWIALPPGPRMRTRWSTLQRPNRSSISASRRCTGSRSSSIPVLEKSALVLPIRQARLASAASASSGPEAARSITGRASLRRVRASSRLALVGGRRTRPFLRLAFDKRQMGSAG